MNVKSGIDCLTIGRSFVCVPQRRFSLLNFLKEHQIRLIALALVTSIFAIPFIALLWMTSVPGQSFAGELPELSAPEKQSSAIMEKHVSIIGVEPHNIEHFEALEKSAVYIEQELKTLGYEFRQQPFSVADQEVRNIEAVIKPASANAQTLVIGAHYDSYHNTNGANDNGSGVAATLELARLLKNLDGNSGLRIRLVFFVNEEPPYFKTEYMGSAVYANALAETDEDVMAMLSLETMGYYSDEAGSQKYPSPLSSLYPETGNFIAFVGDTSARPFVRKLVEDFRRTVQFPSEGGTAPAFLQGIDWSDHRSFSEVGIPALMVTDTAAFRYPHYHSKADIADRVNTDHLARVIYGLSKVIRSWSEEQTAK